MPKSSTRGPLPKRNAERAGHNGIEEMATVVHAQGAVTMPNPRNSWSPDTTALYRSLADSGSSRYYEPSDWQVALITCDMIDRMMLDPAPPAALFNAVMAGLDRLGATESSRRRNSIEVNRDQTVEAASPAVSSRFAKLRAVAEQADA